MELFGSDFVHDSFVSVTIGICKNVTKGGNSYSELPINYEFEANKLNFLISCGVQQCTYTL